MRKLIFASVLTTFIMGSALSAADNLTANAVDECSKEVLLSYFPESFVRDALKSHNVPQDKWDAIIADLKDNDKQIVALVEDKASKMNPNPLKNPADAEQRQKAVGIFRATLLEVFSGALKKNGVTDDKEIQAMLDEVQHQKAKQFKQCLEKHRGSGQATPTGTSTEPATPTEPVAPSTPDTPVPAASMPATTAPEVAPGSETETTRPVQGD